MAITASRAVGPRGHPLLIKSGRLAVGGCRCVDSPGFVRRQTPLQVATTMRSIRRGALVISISPASAGAAIYSTAVDHCFGS